MRMINFVERFCFCLYNCSFFVIDASVLIIALPLLATNILKFFDIVSCFVLMFCIYSGFNKFFCNSCYDPFSSRYVLTTILIEEPICGVFFVEAVFIVLFHLRFTTARIALVYF